MNCHSNAVRCNTNPVSYNTNTVRYDTSPILKWLKFSLCDSNPGPCDPTKSSHVWLKSSHGSDSNPIRCNLNPARCYWNPVRCDSNPVRYDSNPAVCDSNPVECDTNPVRCEKNPIRHDSNPVVYDLNPVRCDSNPVGWLKSSHMYGWWSFATQIYLMQLMIKHNAMQFHCQCSHPKLHSREPIKLIQLWHNREYTLKMFHHKQVLLCS